MTFETRDYPSSPPDTRDIPEIHIDITAHQHQHQLNFDNYRIEPSIDRNAPRRIPSYEPIHYPRGPNNRYIDRDTANSRPPVEDTRRESRAAAPPARPANAPKSGANPVLGIFGLSIRTKERDLEDEFGRYGEVEKVVIVYDQRASLFSKSMRVLKG